VSQIGRHQIICSEVVKLLRKERESRNLSCYAVAQRSGVSQSMLSLVERGLRNPTLELLLKIADGIGIDLAVVLKRAQISQSKAKRK
jgi:transcriptional regulator with XRE-family HTH domain